MSYESVNRLATNTQKRDILELVRLLDYQKSGYLRSDEVGKIEEYYWFDEKDYRSWSGVELSIYNEEGVSCVSTRTTVSRSYYDLIHQNETIRLMEKFFGGTFETDEGKNRYLRPRSGPPTATQAGCHLAFQHFGSNLISAKIYFREKDFPKSPIPKKANIYVLGKMSPWLVSNNLLLPYLVAILEDYFKSSFIALLRYSNKKDSFLKSGRLSSDHLEQISDEKLSIEEAIAENLPFQRISAICKNFKAIDKRIDLASALRKPYRGRKVSLYETIERLVNLRHSFIHRGQIDPSLSDKVIAYYLNDLQVSIIRCYKHLTKVNKWPFEQWWAAGKA